MPPIPVDPVLPAGFDSTPHEERSVEELAAWWGRPYAVSRPAELGGGYTVRCLDGGAWDRPTNYGQVSTLEQASELAASKLAAWQETQARPRLQVLSVEKDLALVVAGPGRPDQPERVLAGPLSIAQAQAWIQAYDSPGDCHRSGVDSTHPSS